MRTTRTGLPTFETIVDQLAKQDGSNGKASVSPGTSPSSTSHSVVVQPESDTFQFHSLQNATAPQNWGIDTSSFQLVPRFASDWGIDKVWLADWFAHDADALPVSRLASKSLHKEAESFAIPSHIASHDPTDFLTKSAETPYAYDHNVPHSHLSSESSFEKSAFLADVASFLI